MLLQTSGTWSANLTRGERGTLTVEALLGSLSLESGLFPRGCLVSSFSGRFFKQNSVPGILFQDHPKLFLWINLNT